MFIHNITHVPNSVQVAAEITASIPNTDFYADRERMRKINIMYISLDQLTANDE